MEFAEAFYEISKNGGMMVQYSAQADMFHPDCPGYMGLRVSRDCANIRVDHVRAVQNKPIEYQDSGDHLCGADWIIVQENELSALVGQIRLRAISDKIAELELEREAIIKNHP